MLQDKLVVEREEDEALRSKAPLKVRLERGLLGRKPAQRRTMRTTTMSTRIARSAQVRASICRICVRPRRTS